MVKRLYRQEPINVIYHPAKVGSHRHCSSGDMTFLRDLDVMKSLPPAWLVLIESTPVDKPVILDKKDCRQIHKTNYNMIFYGMFYSWLLTVS